MGKYIQLLYVRQHTENEQFKVMSKNSKRDLMSMNETVNHVDTHKRISNTFSD